MNSEFETWPATPVESVARFDEVLFALDLIGNASLQTKQPGSAGHSKNGGRN